MPRNRFGLKTVVIFLLIFGTLTHCDLQVNRRDDQPPDGRGRGGSNAFFALRSCHRVMQDDSGDFFSPDYLCSNPPLWCNWTVHVHPGKRVRLHLEDLTPDDACHLKQDQIHVDEPAGHFGGHRVLQKCWREAKYISASNTLYVVLLIGGQPSSPYRGFYGRYQAFGPPVVYDPHDGFTDSKSRVEPALTEAPLGQMGFTEFAPMMDDEQTPPSPSISDLLDDYYEEMEETDTKRRYEEGGNLHQASENHTDDSRFTATPTVEASSQGASPHTLLGLSDRAVRPLSSLQQQDEPNAEPSPRTLTAMRRNVDAQSQEPATSAVLEGDASTPQTVTSAGDGEASDRHPLPSDDPEAVGSEEAHPHPNMVEPLLDHRGNVNPRDVLELPHRPDDHLFEVAVEVKLPLDVEEPWDSTARRLLLSVKALINEKLEVLHRPTSMSSKRIKRLSAGVLYILWLQVSRAPGEVQVHRAQVHDALLGLITVPVGLMGHRGKAVIVSVSTADVNECGIQLVPCDANAECVSRFGSYSCHYRPGLRGTVGVDAEASGTDALIGYEPVNPGCSSGLSAETKGVYVVFFLLSCLMTMLLAAAGVMYRRHHRGAFLLRGSLSPPDLNNNNGYSTPADADLPPPPPVRRPREGWSHPQKPSPAVDLPLLHFSPLLPLDGYREPQEGGKM